ncbi:MAG: flagellar protein FlgN [Tepidisphaeraceae bacterium]
MSQLLCELESVLRLLVGEHRKLLAQLDGQQRAMRGLRLDAMNDVAALHEQTRRRIAALDGRRESLIAQLARQMKADTPPTISQLADIFPGKQNTLRELRDELRELVAQVQSRSSIAARLVAAVLGHLNAAVRVLAGAAEQGGVYTRSGTPSVAPRIGAMETVG